MAQNIIAKKHPVAGFTLIELLVTIVIIGILVGIGVVSYNGIIKQNRQKDLENSLIDAAGKVQNYISKNNKLPIGLSDVGVKNSGGSTFSFIPTVFPDFCIRGTNSGNIFYMGSRNASPSPSGCPSPDIQTVGRINCPTYLAQVKDARDNNSYYIQKLGNDCWMLTNLAYAGAGTNTYNDTKSLSNGTADTATTYTEAKYYIPTGANPTTDPTPPSTDATGGGSGAGRQYGYLYNWCAAMGGQNTAACANATTPTPIPTTNICPAGWRLPTVSPTNEFTALNTAINGGSTSSDAGLLTSGLFQRSGYWGGSFSSQGSYGYYWSSTQGSATVAYSLFFGSTDVSPAVILNKNNARTVRCVAE